jgi:Holliday junction resolvasome RuvABC endonuclease subunit
MKLKQGDIILALDLATRWGWCYWVSGAFNPEQFGSVNLSDNGPMDVGPMLARFEDEVVPLIDQADLVVFEAPILPGGKKSNPKTSRKLMGMTGMVEKMCYQRGKPILEEQNRRVRKHFTGVPSKDSATGKANVLKACKLLGYDVKNDDEADAIALANYANVMLGRHIW